MMGRFQFIFGIVYMFVCFPNAAAHDIYNDLRDKSVGGVQGSLCCGGNDCAATIYRQSGHKYEFRTKENTWIEVPEERIVFLPIAGDKGDDGTVRNYAHLCYTNNINQYSDTTKIGTDSSGRHLLIYCAYIPPGSI